MLETGWWCSFVYHVDQRNLGMSMKVERSTVDQIKQRFEFNKKKKEEEKKKYGACITQLVVWFERY